MIGLLSYNALWVLSSTLVLGMAAGIMGCLAYWKQQSLMSDTLSHAALPGVIIGFMIMGTKNLPIMLLGAAISAWIGAWFIQRITIETKIKADAAMGIILSVFFGFGIMLLSVVNRFAGGGQSGLDSFIFGQAASMVQQDVIIMMVVAFFVIIFAILFFKEWKIYLFDPLFASGLGISHRFMNSVYTLLLVIVIVTGIQAVGVILMAALLIIPSVSARYWSQSFGGMLFISALFGGGAGAGGTLISTMGSGWPTGPFIVLAASTIFVASFLFGSSKGIVVHYLHQRLLRKKQNINHQAVVSIRGRAD